MNQATEKLALVLIVCAAGLSVIPTAHARDWSDVSIADGHLHLLDFLQNSDYLEGTKLVEKNPGQTLASGHRGKRIEAVIWAMDRANVGQALVTGMPFLKKWSDSDPFRPGYYLDSSSRMVRARDTDYHLALAIEDYRRDGGEAAAQQLERIFPCISGFDTTDLGAVDMVAKRLKEFPGLFKCIGEVMSRHDDLTNLTTGERPRADHPSLFRLFDFAGEHELPVMIHHNIAPVSPSGDPKPPHYLGELMTAFETFPDTTFLWCHAGISRRIVIEDLAGIIDNVLSKHSQHVLIDLSWVVYPDYVMKDLARWAALIKKYPENFLIGSDAVGRFGDYTDEIRVFDALFEAIGNRKIVDALAHGNFLRVMPERGVVLDSGYVYPEDRYSRPSPTTR